MAINFKNAKFRSAHGSSAQLPKSIHPEVAFAGRSNVGKSSLLNKLLYRKNLARVSSQPGKTATINFYELGGCDLVDLPGYGFAKVSKSERQRWSELIEAYFAQDRRFALIASLVDIRHEASKLDEQMISFLKESTLPFAVILTKADKLSRQQANKQMSAIRKQLALPKEIQIVVTSSEKGTGIDELRALINSSVDKI